LAGPSPWKRSSLGIPFPAAQIFKEVLGMLWLSAIAFGTLYDVVGSDITPIDDRQSLSVDNFER
jgi:hypothetical protein